MIKKLAIYKFYCFILVKYGMSFKKDKILKYLLFIYLILQSVSKSSL